MIWLLLACGPTPAPTCDDTASGACFTGHVRSLLGSPVQGMTLCTPELPDLACVVTAADGTWTLPGLPVDTDVIVTGTHPEYAPVVFPQNTAMDWYDWYKVAVPLSVMESNANQLDVTLDPERGQLLFLAWQGLNLDGVDTDNVAGVTATLDPQSELLFYASGLGIASPSATETSDSGSGGALNLAPGTVHLSLTGPAGPCGQEPMFHHAADGDRIPVPILAGFTTAIDVQCPD